MNNQPRFRDRLAYGIVAFMLVSVFVRNGGFEFIEAMTRGFEFDLSFFGWIR